MTSRFADHILGPDTHANRPAASTVPYGALYECTTHNLIYKNVAGAWSTWAAIVPNGGTAGQVLTKNSSTDGDAAWSTASGGGGASTSACRATKSGTQTLTHNVSTAVLFDAEDFDDAAYHDTSSNTSRFTAPATGRYRFTAGFGVLSARAVFFSARKNGSTVITYDAALSTAAPSGGTPVDGQCLTTLSTGPIALTTADYIELVVLPFRQVATGDAQRDTGVPAWATFERIT